MKFAITAFLSLLANVGASSSAVAAAANSHMIELNDIKADSDLGMKILSKARNLEDWDNVQSAWISGYSIKFVGCHHVSQWNEEAADEAAVRVLTKRLVRFRLCPTTFCSATNTVGCDDGYGEYIIDMSSFLTAYAEAKSYQSQNYQQNGYQNQDYSAYNYDQNANGYQNANYQNANYQNANANGYVDVSEYTECTQASFGNGRRDLQDNSYYGNYNNWDGSYYVSPYCASQGGGIYLGVFTDDQCTTFADNNGGRDTYSAKTGMSLNYGSKNLIESTCIPCSEQKYSNYYGNDADDSDDVYEFCENIYTRAGKCEENLAYGVTYLTNNNGCNFLEAMKIIRKDGTVRVAEMRANKTANTFIGLFSAAFLLLSAYIYYLKSKLDRSSINLTED